MSETCSEMLCESAVMLDRKYLILVCSITFPFVQAPKNHCEKKTRSRIQCSLFSILMNVKKYFILNLSSRSRKIQSRPGFSFLLARVPRNSIFAFDSFHSGSNWPFCRNCRFNHSQTFTLLKTHLNPLRQTHSFLSYRIFNLSLSVLTTIRKHF